MVLALREIGSFLYGINRNKLFFSMFLAAVVSCSAVINLNQYFVIYPKEKSAFMDFSPASTNIARLINEKHKEYSFFVSKSEKMYGFYSWEQKVMLEFLTYGKGVYRHLEDVNAMETYELYEVKGAAIVVRPSDEEYIKRIEADFPRAGREDFVNEFNGEIIYICYYIFKDDIPKNKRDSLIYIRD